MDEFSSVSYHKAIRVLPVRFEKNGKAFASLCIALALYSEMPRTTTLLGVRMSVIKVNYNVPLPPRQK